MKVITSCDACIHLEIRELLTQYFIFCCAKADRREVKHTLPIPEWCPLKRVSSIEVKPKERENVLAGN